MAARQPKLVISADAGPGARSSCRQHQTISVDASGDHRDPAAEERRTPRLRSSSSPEGRRRSSPCWPPAALAERIGARRSLGAPCAEVLPITMGREHSRAGKRWVWAAAGRGIYLNASRRWRQGRAGSAGAVNISRWCSRKGRHGDERAAQSGRGRPPRSRKRYWQIVALFLAAGDSASRYFPAYRSSQLSAIMCCAQRGFCALPRRPSAAQKAPAAGQYYLLATRAQYFAAPSGQAGYRRW